MLQDTKFEKLTAIANFNYSFAFSGVRNSCFLSTFKFTGRCDSFVPDNQPIWVVSDCVAGRDESSERARD